MSLLQRKLGLLSKNSQRIKSNAQPRGRSAEVDSVRGKESLLEHLGGEFVSTRAGEILVIRQHYSLDHSYGNDSLGSALAFQPSELDSLYSGLGSLRLGEALFFDTETTGLAGGSGTYAFLVGIGFFDNDGFTTEQLLMRDHADEPALLEYLASRIMERSGLVSFNGKTFDAQLLTTRYAMHRQKSQLEGLAHFDLLHVCRRLWGKAQLPDCRLETLENFVLGAPRHDDVPGWMIPELFFQFLADRNPKPLVGVVEHNRRDLLAMVGLCGQLHKIIVDDVLTCGGVQYGLGRLMAALSRYDRSDLSFRRALQSGDLDFEAQEHCHLLWARELKKRGETEQSAKLWRRALARNPRCIEATVELAKWLEHKQKDYRRALVLVEGGLTNRLLPPMRRRELLHRADRLQRRLEGTQTHVREA